MRGHLVLLLAFWVVATGCEASPSVFVKRTWSTDKPMILVIADAEERPIPGTPRFLGEDPERIYSLPASDEVHLFVQTYPGLERIDAIAACRLSTGDEGVGLGPPSVSWRSDLLRLGDDEVVMTEEAVPRDLGLRLDGCVIPERPCELTMSNIDIGVAPHNLDTVAAAGGGRFYAGGRGADTFDPGALFRIDGDRSTLLPAHSVLEGKIQSIVVRDGTPVAVTQFGGLAELDEEGTLLRDGKIPFIVSDVAQGEDGLTLIAGRNGELVQLTRGSTLTVPFTPTPSFRPPDEDRDASLAVWDQNRIALQGHDGYLYRFDRGVWISELPTEETSFEAVAIDAATIMAVARNGGYLYTDAEDRWRSVGEPFPGERARSLAGWGDGRYLAVGDAGRVALYNGERWCDLERATLQDLRKIAVAPDGRSAIAVGNSEVRPGRPAVIHFERPD